MLVTSQPLSPLFSMAFSRPLELSVAYAEHRQASELPYSDPKTHKPTEIRNDYFVASTPVIYCALLFYLLKTVTQINYSYPFT